MLAPLLQQRDPAAELQRAFALFANGKTYITKRDLQRVADEVEAGAPQRRLRAHVRARVAHPSGAADDVDSEVIAAMMAQASAGGARGRVSFEQFASVVQRGAALGDD